MIGVGDRIAYGTVLNRRTGIVYHVLESRGYREYIIHIKAADGSPAGTERINKSFDPVVIVSFEERMRAATREMVEL